MAIDVDKRVQTTFTVTDRTTANVMRMSKAMQGLGRATTNSKRMLQAFNAAQNKTTRGVAAGQKATQRLAGTTRQASRANRQFRSEINNVRYSLIGMTVAAAGFFSVMQTRKIIKISDDFEQTRLAIAGTLKALGFAKDFDTAMDISAAAMEKIRIQAALLPGTATEYVEVFRAGLAGMRGGIKGTLSDLIKFSGTYTALAKTMKIDAPQAGRDLALMLAAGRGRAGAMVRTFRQLLPTIQELPGHAQLTAKAFNEMSQVMRGNILQQALAAHVDQIKAAKDTWDAQAGALQSNIDLARRLGGAPLFEGMKNAMQFMNDKLVDANGNMLPLMKNIIGIGEAISKGIVAGMEAAAAAAKKLYDWTNKAIGVASGMAGLMGGGKSATEGAARAGAAAMPNAQMGSAVAAAVGATAILLGASGPLGLAIAGIADFASRTEAVTAMFVELQRFGDMLAVPFAAIANASMLVAGLLGDVLEGALGGFISMVTDIVGPILGFFAGALNQTAMLFTAIRPTLLELWKSIGLLFKSIGQFLNPVIRILGTALVGIFKIARFILTPVLNVLGTVIMAVVTVFSLLISKIGSWLGLLADSFEEVTGIKTMGGLSDRDKALGEGGRDFLGEFLDSFRTKTTTGGDESLLSVTAPTTPTARGGGGRVVNDFRYSRFQIDQKFAEGFDPDRIAVAFASDLGKIGETKLQSGFDPLFSLQ